MVQAAGNQVSSIQECFSLLKKSETVDSAIQTILGQVPSPDLLQKLEQVFTEVTDESIGIEHCSEVRKQALLLKEEIDRLSDESWFCLELRALLRTLSYTLHTFLQTITMALDLLNSGDGLDSVFNMCQRMGIWGSLVAIPIGLYILLESIVVISGLPVALVTAASTLLILLGLWTYDRWLQPAPIAIPWAENMKRTLDYKEGEADRDDYIGRVQLINKLLLNFRSGDAPNIVIKGPPGSGKTTLIEALQAKAPDLTFYKVTMSELMDANFVHSFSRRLEIIVDILKNHPNVILCIDEFQHLFLGDDEHSFTTFQSKVLDSHIPCLMFTTNEGYEKIEAFVKGRKVSGPLMRRIENEEIAPLSDIELKLLLLKKARKETLFPVEEGAIDFLVEKAAAYSELERTNFVVGVFRQAKELVKRTYLETMLEEDASTLLLREKALDGILDQVPLDAPAEHTDLADQKKEIEAYTLLFKRYREIIKTKIVLAKSVLAVECNAAGKLYFLDRVLQPAYKKIIFEKELQSAKPLRVSRSVIEGVLPKPIEQTVEPA